MGSRPVGKESFRLLHDWILYSMGTLIPSIHLVSFIYWNFIISFFFLTNAVSFLPGYPPPLEPAKTSVE